MHVCLSSFTGISCRQLYLAGVEWDEIDLTDKDYAEMTQNVQDKLDRKNVGMGIVMVPSRMHP